MNSTVVEDYLQESDLVLEVYHDHRLIHEDKWHVYIWNLKDAEEDDHVLEVSGKTLDEAYMKLEATIKEETDGQVDCAQGLR